MKKDELKKQIEATREQLKRLEEELDSASLSLEQADVGDFLEDGWLVIEKKGGLALLAAPIETQKLLTWFHRKLVLEQLPGDCFIPSMKHINLAATNCGAMFLGLTRYEKIFYISSDGLITFNKRGEAVLASLPKCDWGVQRVYRTRAFRCVLYDN